MKNIKTMRALSSALLIFACFIVVVILSVYFFSADQNKAENETARELVYRSIGDIEGEGDLKTIIYLLNDNVQNPDIEKIVNCFTNSSVAVFRDHLRAVSFSMGQFCKVQKNLEATATSHQNNSDRCKEPDSIILSEEQLEKLGRAYTGDFAADMSNCKI